jgi:hypothetical protein
VQEHWLVRVRVDQLGEAGSAKYRRASIGMIFEFFNLLDDLTVLDNVMDLNGEGQTILLVTHVRRRSVWPRGCRCPGPCRWGWPNRSPGRPGPYWSVRRCCSAW